ncbi:hypothetical protein ACKWTF_016182 [Chironomus riparius]
MKFEISLVFLIAVSLKGISCGGGNQQICWFYQSQFDQSLRTYSRVTNSWAEHIINLMQTYSAQNPFEQPDILSTALSGIVSGNTEMFTTYLNNFAKEIAALTETDVAIVTEAYKSAQFGSPFPLSCIPNLAEAGNVYNNALGKVDDEKSAIERTSHGLDG